MPPRGRTEEGVTPVVGTLLILAIFTVSLSAILFWGLPLYHATREQAAFEDTRADLRALVDDVRGLALVGSAKEIQRPVVGLPGGELAFETGSRMLLSFGVQAADYEDLVGTEVDEDDIVDLTWAGWEDGDEELVATNRGAAFTSNVYVEVREFRSSGSPVIYSDGDPSWGTGVAKTLTLSSAAAGRVVVVDLFDGTSPDPANLRARAILLDLTRIRFTWPAERHDFDLVSELGGIFAKSQVRYHVDQEPLLALPTLTLREDGTREQDTLSLRIPLLSGRGAFAGRDHVAVTMRLAATNELLLGPATALVRFHVAGPYEAQWEAYWTSVGFAEDALYGGHVYELKSGTAVLPVRLAVSLAQIETAVGVA